MLKSVPGGRGFESQAEQKIIFSDKIHQRRKINDQSRGTKAKRHTPIEYDDLH
jgi:hypothetical protein